MPDTLVDCVGRIADAYALSCGADYSTYVSESWDEVWADIIGNGEGLYNALSNTARLVAAFSFIFLLAKWVRDAIDDKFYFFSSDVIWPFIVILALSSNGLLLRETSMGLRNLINGTNNQVLTVVDNTLKFEDKFTEISDYIVSDRYLRNIRSQCNGITNNDVLIACLENATAQAQEILDTYSASHGNTNLFQKIQNYTSSVMESLADNPAQGFNLFIAPLTNNLFKLVIEELLVAFQTAFQQVVELSMLLTALLAPLFLGASLLPMQGRPIIAWFTGFISVGIAKLCFNIVSALIVTEVYNSGFVDDAGNLLLMTFFAPMLALAMAAGGGMAIFSGVVSSVSSLVSFGLYKIR